LAVHLPWVDEARQERFARYVEALGDCLRHTDRIEPFQRYCVGLLIPGERKSVEPIAARLNPQRTAAEHQSLLDFVGQAPWDADRLLQAVRAEVLPVMSQREPVAAWIIDDTGFP
jgi:SRSO17 transposase